MLKKAIYECLLGTFEMEYAEETLLRLKKISSSPLAEKMKNEKSPFSDKVFAEVLEYLAGERKEFSFVYAGKGTEFQQKVWKALCDIPYGETRTYKDIAVVIGNEKACRAVGMANNKNPISIIVPCHRVIGSNGKLVGYAGGLDTKAHLLALETRYK